MKTSERLLGFKDILNGNVKMNPPSYVEGRFEFTDKKGDQSISFQITHKGDHTHHIKQWNGDHTPIKVLNDSRK